MTAAHAAPIVLTPSVFSQRGTEGDFGWMIEQPRWQHTLFVFNDSERQSQAFLAQYARGEIAASSPACEPGGGNAVIRPYRCRTPPRAAGVPTGPGYTRLTEHVTQQIDRALAHIEALLTAEHGYTEVIYSASREHPHVLGHGIFDVGAEVLRYVPAELARIVAEANTRLTGGAR